MHANEAHAVTAAWLAGAHRQAAFVISRRVGYPLAKGALALARYKAAARIVAISQWVCRTAGGVWRAERKNLRGV